MRARVLHHMRAPFRYNQLTCWLLFDAFWLHRAVTLLRPNTILNCSVNQSELLSFHSYQLRASKNCGPGCCSTSSTPALNVALKILVCSRFTRSCACGTDRWKLGYRHCGRRPSVCGCVKYLQASLLCFFSLAARILSQSSLQLMKQWLAGILPVLNRQSA